MYIAKKNVKLTALEISKIVNGEVFGDANAEVKTLSSSDKANDIALSFFNGMGKKQIINEVQNQKTKIMLVKDIDGDLPCIEGKATIKVKHAYFAFLQMIPYFFESVSIIDGISEFAEIGENVAVGENFKLGAFSCIGENTIIGDNVTIHPNCTIYPNCKIGNNVEIHAGAVIRERCVLGDNIVIQNGAVIGADGFGYVPDAQMGIRPVPQLGNVVLDSFVDVGANTCIDRAAVSTTKIGYSTKIDNLVQIGHNVEIGQFSFLCGQVGIAGSAKIGNQVTLAGNSGVADHVKIADGVRVGGKTAIGQDITQKGDYFGELGRPAMKQKRINVLIDNLQETLAKMKKDIKELQERK